ncbi:hypothetical protein [Neobacillus novalis]|nr:hypothetical protein [Neobacillus novalis]
MVGEILAKFGGSQLKMAGLNKLAGIPIQIDANWPASKPFS